MSMSWCTEFLFINSFKLTIGLTTLHTLYGQTLSNIYNIEVGFEILYTLLLVHIAQVFRLLNV